MIRHELFIGNKKVDLMDNPSCPITKAAYNIDNPNQRNSDRSKTWTVPGSKNNNEVFKALFDVNFSIEGASFNPAKKSDCVYLQDTLDQIKGYCQLSKINIIDRENITYDIVIYGLNRDFFAKIADGMLRDLDLSVYDHVYNDTNVQASWAATLGVGYVYPMVDRGFQVDYVNNVSTGESWATTAFRPWVYWKTIWDKIFQDAGTTYESSFLNSTVFKRGIMEGDIDDFRLSEADVDNYTSKAFKSGTQSIIPNASNLPVSRYGNQNIIFNNETSDPAGQYNPTTGTFTASLSGYYTFESTLSIILDRTSGSYTNGQAILLTLWLIVKQGSVYRVQSSTWHQGVYLTITDQVAISSYINTPILLTAGDEVQLCVGDIGPVGFTGSFNTDFSVIIGTSQMVYYPSADSILGSTINLTNVMPDMKQNDFIMGLVKMFNLYIEPKGEGEDTVLVIEPRDDYFINDVEDWTPELDNSKEFSNIPQGLLTNKALQFQYAESEDVNNRQFKNEIGYNYGYRLKIFDNEFVKDVKKVEIPFSMATLGNISGGRVGMRIRYYDNDGRPMYKNGKPFIALYGGLQDNVTPWNYILDNGTVSTQSSYPYAGHLDHPITPENDLTFGRQPFYFFHTPSAGGLTLNIGADLYSKYHHRQWEEIGDKDSKLVECYIKLNAYAIAKLSFRKLYYVKDAYYRLLEVVDHDPEYIETTKVRLLKLKIANPIIPGLVTTNYGKGGSGTRNNAERNHFNTSTASNGSNTNISNIGGARTNVGGGGVGIWTQGIGNTVGDGCVNVVIIGNGNTVAPGLRDIVIIGDGHTVTLSGTTIYGTTVTPYTVTGTPSTKTVDVDDSGLDEVRNVLGSLINDLTTKKLIP